MSAIKEMLLNRNKNKDLAYLDIHKYNTYKEKTIDGGTYLMEKRPTDCRNTTKNERLKKYRQR